MITIKEQLFVTKEINRIIQKYAKQNVLPRLLNQFAFNKKGKISDLLETVGYYKATGGPLPSECMFSVMELINDFLNKLSNDDKTALYFWFLNENYDNYYEEFEMDLETDDSSEEEMNHDDYSKQNLDQYFGRDLAHRIYDPIHTKLESDLKEKLYNHLLCFASEHDLSEIDDYTIEYVHEVILMYSEK
jgi:hypothetical protein